MQITCSGRTALRSILLVWLLAVGLAEGIAQQPGDMPPNPEPGKCYAKSLVTIPASTDTTWLKYPVYIGEDDVPMKPVRHKSLVRNGVVEESLTLEVPRKVRKLPQDDVIYEEYSTITLVEAPSTHVGWVEIVCGSDVTPSFVREVAAALATRGYGVGPPAQMMGRELRQALSAFQRDHGLPAGQLDFETFNALHVRL